MENQEIKIWQNCVQRAIAYLDKNHWDKINDSTKYDLVFKDKKYPTKLILGQVYEYIQQENPEIHLPTLGGGKPIKLFLEKLGFDVLEKSVFEEIILDNRNIYKLSMGIFVKNTKFRGLNLVERLSKLDLVSMHIKTSKNQGNLFNNLQIGDFVYITYGKEKLGALCIIDSDLIELPNDIKDDIDDDGYKARKIKIIKNPVINNTENLKADRRFWLPSGNSTLYEILNLDDSNKILFNKYYNLNIIDKKMEKLNFKEKLNLDKNEFLTPLNQILYGPPGTGKTYNTINKAISIANPIFDLNQDRISIKNEYDRLVNANQIMFTTFHQSMAYEDFIEGIKPETKNDNVTYDVQNGLFLKICRVAEDNIEDVRLANNKMLSFEDAFSILQEEWFENEDLKFPLKREGNDFTIIGFTNKSIQFKKASGGVGHTLSIATLRNYFYDKIEINLTGVGIYYPSILDKLKTYQPKIIEDKTLKNYVLIIDEINRGNVSAIFGELITLIEEDKRIGKPEALMVTLPYSKKPFGVPSNLYIIGTMNTADRSVEALDTALRRRFSFEEMPPNYELTELSNLCFGYPASKILRTINHRIEKLLDKDHAIGHSYFINKDDVSIVESFYKCIIPLLQEYFFGDYGKIGLVLGKGFVKLKEWDRNSDSFAVFEDYGNSDDFEERNVFEIIDYRNKNQIYKIKETEMTFGLAINLLMKGTIE